MKKLFDLIMKHADKVIHFSVGYGLATILPIPPTYGLLLALFVTAAKEWWDGRNGSDANIADFAAGVAGGVLGFLAVAVRLAMLGL